MSGILSSIRSWWTNRCGGIGKNNGNSKVLQQKGSSTNILGSLKKKWLSLTERSNHSRDVGTIKVSANAPAGDAGQQKQTGLQTLSPEAYEVSSDIHSSSSSSQGNGEKISSADVETEQTPGEKGTAEEKPLKIDLQGTISWKKVPTPKEQASDPKTPETPTAQSAPQSGVSGLVGEADTPSAEQNPVTTSFESDPGSVPSDTSVDVGTSNLKLGNLPPPPEKLPPVTKERSSTGFVFPESAEKRANIQQGEGIPEQAIEGGIDTLTAQTEVQPMHGVVEEQMQRPKQAIEAPQVQHTVIEGVMPQQTVQIPRIEIVSQPQQAITGKMAVEEELIQPQQVAVEEVKMPEQQTAVYLSGAETPVPKYAIFTEEAPQPMHGVVEEQMQRPQQAITLGEASQVQYAKEEIIQSKQQVSIISPEQHATIVSGTSTDAYSDLGIAENIIQKANKLIEDAEKEKVFNEVDKLIYDAYLELGIDKAIEEIVKDNDSNFLAYLMQKKEYTKEVLMDQLLAEFILNDEETPQQTNEGNVTAEKSSVATAPATPASKPKRPLPPPPSKQKPPVVPHNTATSGAPIPPEHDSGVEGVPPPPPPPTAPGVPPPPVASGSGSGMPQDLLSAIQQGKKLNKTSKVPKEVDPHDNLMEQIRKGLKLKKVEPKPQKTPSEGSFPSSDLKTSLQEAFEKMPKKPESSEPAEEPEVERDESEWEDKEENNSGITPTTTPVGPSPAPTTSRKGSGRPLPPRPTKEQASKSAPATQSGTSSSVTGVPPAPQQPNVVGVSGGESKPSSKEQEIKPNSNATQKDTSDRDDIQKIIQKAMATRRGVFGQEDDDNDNNDEW